MTEARDSEAHHKIDTHEKVCAERYGNIWEALKGIRADMSTDRAARATADQVVHDRFNTVSNRMWAALAAVSAASIAGIGALAFYLMTRGHG